MTIERSDLQLLLHIQHQQSLAGAARQLDLAPTVVSKRLAALEARLGVSLLRRTTRRLQLTTEGEVFVEQARTLAAGFEQLEEQLAERRDVARGRLRVASSFGFGRVWLAPVLAALRHLHPAVEVELHLFAHLPDMGSGQFDAAVWLWQPDSPALVTRRLAPNRRVVVAAPAYLKRRGEPLTPEDLSNHDCLVVHEQGDSPAMWRLQNVGKRGAASRKVRVNPQVGVRVSGPLSSNHGEVVREWALQGHGLMLRSLWDVHSLLANGQLVQVLHDWAMPGADVTLVLPPRDLRLTTPRRVRVLQEHLVAAFAQPPWMLPLSVLAQRRRAPPATRRQR